LASTKSNLNPLTTILEQKRRKKMATELEDVKINVKIKLSALWATLMFLYIYADLLGNMEPGHIEGVISGEVAGLQITPAFLLGSTILMAIPSLMVFLSLTVPPKANRWANIIWCTGSRPFYRRTFHCLYIFFNCRSCAYCTDRLVCMEVA